MVWFDFGYDDLGRRNTCDLNFGNLGILIIIKIMTVYIFGFFLNNYANNNLIVVIK